MELTSYGSEIRHNYITIQIVIEDIFVSLIMFLLCLFYLLFFLCKRYGIVMVNGALNAAKCKCKMKRPIYREKMEPN